MARAEVIAGLTALAMYTGGGVNYVVRDNNGVFWFPFVDRAVDVSYTKSNDGISWQNPVTVFVGSATALSSWYPRWSGVADDKICLAYTESGGADILFRTIDTAAIGALGTQTTVFNGASTASGGALSICMDRGGHIRVVGSIDNGTEDGAWSSTDGGATWTDTIADPSEGATQDQYLLLPGWNLDTHDMMLIFWDASANELSVKRYDDSADTWTETSIATSMVDSTAANFFPNFAACVDLANSRNIVVAWSAVDAANADLRMWFIDDTTITESSANVVLNSTDDQGLCAVGLDTATGTIYVFYGGKSDGSETFSSAINIYYKTTTDNGATWSAETKLSNAADPRGTQWLACTPRFSTDYLVAIYNNIADPNIIINAVMPTGSSIAASIFGGNIAR